LGLELGLANLLLDGNWGGMCSIPNAVQFRTKQGKDHCSSRQDKTENEKDVLYLVTVTSNDMKSGKSKYIK